jgi:hypothetical protein
MLNYLEGLKLMLDIQIDNDYKIISDERNFTLQFRTIITGDNEKGKQPKPENIGQERWVDEGHYRTIRQLLEDYTRINTLKSKAGSFEELFKVLDNIKKTIMKIKDINNLLDKSVKEIK